MDNKKIGQVLSVVIIAAVAILGLFFPLTVDVVEQAAEKAVERGSLLCATEWGNCVESWNGADIAVYSDAGSTQKALIDGATGAVQVPYGVEHIGLPSLITASVAYTPTSGTIATIGADEVWLVHSVFVNVHHDFDCTGDDCTLTIGDGNDADGFIAAADASLQAAFTEATGYTAGWYGIENGSNGAYTVDEGGPFVYAPSSAETIDYAVGGTSPVSGTATVYVLYTRIQ